MKKAASVFLRGDICRRDLELLARWLGNVQVTRYLNEHKSAVYELSRLADTVPEPMLGYHLNRHGHFFMICTHERQPIGFVKLVSTATAREYEIVYAIGEDRLWGLGYGENAIEKAMDFAFAGLGAASLIAKIDPENIRSRRLAAACGFEEAGLAGTMVLFRAAKESKISR